MEHMFYLDVNQDVVEFHRSAAGAHFELAERIAQQLHFSLKELLPLADDDDVTAADPRILATFLLGCHGVNLMISIGEHILVGRFDVGLYLLRPIFDVGPMLARSVVDPEYAQRVLDDSDLKPSEARVGIVSIMEGLFSSIAPGPSAAKELNSSWMAESKEIQNLAHTTRRHLFELGPQVNVGGTLSAQSASEFAHHLVNVGIRLLMYVRSSGWLSESSQQQVEELVLCAKSLQATQDSPVNR